MDAQIDLYGGERLRFTEEKLDGNLAIVRAKLTTKQGTEVPVEAPPAALPGLGAVAG